MRTTPFHERTRELNETGLEEYFPGFGDLVLHREVVTPLDIERTVGLSEGNIYAGRFLPPRCTSSARRPEGTSTELRSAGTTSAVQEPTLADA